MELAGNEPGVSGQLDEFHQAVGGEAGEFQARSGELIEIVIVEFISMAMTLEYRLFTV